LWNQGKLINQSGATIRYLAYNGSTTTTRFPMWDKMCEHLTRTIKHTCWPKTWHQIERQGGRWRTLGDSSNYIHTSRKKRPLDLFNSLNCQPPVDMMTIILTTIMNVSLLFIIKHLWSAVYSFYNENVIKKLFKLNYDNKIEKQ